MKLSKRIPFLQRESTGAARGAKLKRWNGISHHSRRRVMHRHLRSKRWQETAGTGRMTPSSGR